MSKIDTLSRLEGAAPYPHPKPKKKRETLIETGRLLETKPQIWLVPSSLIKSIIKTFKTL